MKKICQYCKKEFDAEENKTKFCSRKCFVISRMGVPHRKRARITKICEGCGKPFETFKSWSFKRFCSLMCRHDFFFKKNKTIIENIEIICSYCGKHFVFKKIGNIKIPKYCSPKCRSAHWYHTEIKNCFQCGKPLQKQFMERVKYKFCSEECRKESQKIRLESVTRQGVRRALKRRGIVFERCADCGYDKYPQILGIHHIDDNPINHSIDNLIIICPNCHSIRHNRHLIKPAGHLQIPHH